MGRALEAKKQIFSTCIDCLKNLKGESIEKFHVSEGVVIEIEYEVTRSGGRSMLSVILSGADGNCVFGSLSNVKENVYHGRQLSSGRYLTRCFLSGNLLNDGQYFVSVVGASDFWTDSFRVEHAISFEVLDAAQRRRPSSGRSKCPPSQCRRRQGPFDPLD